MKKLPKNRYIWTSKILVLYLNNPSEETVSKSKKIMEQHETMKL